MEIWQAIVLGAVQGFAEFLPISSSGHLLMFQRWFGITEGGLFFDIMLHIGTLVPVFIVFYKQIFSLFRKPFDKLIFLIIATIPAALTGFFLGDIVESVFYGGDLLAAILLSVTFLLTAGELFLSEFISKRNNKALPLSYKSSIAMGLAQGMAIVPGLSRSGTVISSGCFCGIDRNENANFTFLMSIPIILGAALVSGLDVIEAGGEIDAVPLIFGMITSMVTGYIAIKAMLAVIKTANYKWFSLYLVLMSVASVVSFVALGV